MTDATRLLFVAMAAVLPAVIVLWRGRSLALLADDPALPERLLANRTRTSAVSVVCLAVLIVIGGTHLAWALPVLVVTLMAAGYPLRKILYQETWSFRRYLSFFLRMAVAAFGFWILLSLTPSLVALSGSYEWIAAGALAIVLLAWSENHVRVFRAVLRTRPIADPLLVDRFARMVKTAGLPFVALEQVDLRGGVFANAAALPSIRCPTVVVSDTLIERLDHEEVAAILGHELAHIEHYNPRRLRRMSLITSAFVVGSSLLTPVTRLAVPEASGSMLVLWSLGLVVVIALRARNRQKHETDSDLRALALAGNPEALIRALTKLHAFARVPRRWDTEFERRATHPSLARRIQAIHAAAGTRPAALGEAATFDGANGSSVTFDDQRLIWNEGPSATHTLDYGQLTMLRLDARHSDAPRLVAVDQAHRRLEMVLQSSDVARAQATLDIVDTRLAVAAVRVPGVSPAVSRALALIALTTALSAAQVLVVAVAWLVIILPAAPSVTAAAGAASVGAAALVWRNGFASSDAQPWIALGLMLCGLSLIAVSVANRRERTTAAVSTLTALLAVCTAGAFGAIALAGVNAIDLHYAALEWPSAVVSALALAGACAFTQRPSLRYASVPVAVASLVVFALGTAAFLDRFADDPFLPRAGTVTMTTVSGAARAEFTVPFEATVLRLSPAGQFVALDSENEDEETTIHAGRAGGPLTDFTADDAVFVDEGRLLMLERRRDESVLRVVDLQHENREVWSQRLPVSAAALSFDVASNEWRLLGLNGDDIVSEAGVLGNHGVREERWTEPVDEGLDALSVSGRELLALESPRRYIVPRSPYRLLMAIVQPHIRAESRFWTVSEHGSSTFITSRLDLNCRVGPLGEPGTTCTAFDGARTGFFTVDPATRRSTILTSVPGHFYVRTGASRGWVQGWWNGRLVLLSPAARQAISVVEADAMPVTQLAIAGKTLAAASLNSQGSTIRLHSIE